MVAIKKDTPRGSITIQKEVFTVPQPYVAGHALTDNEAAALNQMFAENIGNNRRAAVTAAKEEGSFDHAAVQAELDAYAAEYEFGVRRGGARVADPVERQAMEMAVQKVKESLKAQGYVLKDFTTDQLNGLARDALETYPVIREQAQRIVDAQAELKLDMSKLQK